MRQRRSFPCFSKASLCFSMSIKHTWLQKNRHCVFHFSSNINPFVCADHQCRLSVCVSVRTVRPSSKTKLNSCRPFVCLCRPSVPTVRGFRQCQEYIVDFVWNRAIGRMGELDVRTFECLDMLKAIRTTRKVLSFWYIYEESALE